jgi:hypothetical protein
MTPRSSSRLSCRGPRPIHRARTATPRRMA